MSKILESVNKRDFDRRISEVFEMLEEKQLYGTISLIKDLKYYLDLATKEKAHDCNCQRNSNSRDNEPCCRCDSKFSENDDTKKQSYISGNYRKGDRQQSILRNQVQKKVGEDYYHVGYSSFNIDNVLKWRDECFELVDAKATHADRIRNMSDGELAGFLTTFKNTFGEEYEGEASCMEWLQSEAE